MNDVIKETTFDGRPALMVQVAGQQPAVWDMPAQHVIDNHGAFILAVTATAQALHDLAGAVATVSADSDLSEIGRTKRLATVKETALVTAARQYATLEEAEGNLAKLEAARYAPSPLDPANAAGAIADWEMRDRLASLPTGEAIRALESSEAMRNAILRSPYDVGALKKVAEARAREALDLADPAGRGALDAHQAALEWARRATLTLCARLRSVAGLPRSTMAGILARHTNGRGAFAFGVTADEVLSASRARAA